MIEIHEKAQGRVIDGIFVKPGRLDGMRVFLARKDGHAAWGLTQDGAVKAWTETAK